MSTAMLKPASSRVASTRPASSARRAVVCSAQGLKAVAKNVTEKAANAAAVLAATALVAGSANALTFDQLQSLSYMEVKGTGLANTCPTIEGGSTNPKDLKPGQYKLDKFCIEPTSITVKEDSQFKGGEADFVPTKLMTRLTYTLEQMTGSFKVDGSGNVTLKEDDGIDSAPVTVQLPGGERVPFLFSVKELEAKGTVDGFGGEFTVPSYRGATFLDPKGRGAATGYDTAVALPAAGDADELEKENLKKTPALKGQAVFSIAKVDTKTGEVAGVFESVQPSDTDLGAKAPKDVKITGLWYAQLS